MKIPLHFRQKEQELNSIRDQVFTQLADIKKEWLASMAELSQRKIKLEQEFAEMPDKNTLSSQKISASINSMKNSICR
jgi:tyrosine-protein kinase Etk/Wzc